MSDSLKSQKLEGCAVSPLGETRPPDLDGELLSIEDLHFRYAMATEEVLKGLTLSVDSGTMVLVIGPTGCGKTTMVLTMNGLAPAATGGKLTGNVTVADMSTHEFGTHNLSSVIGVVFQDPEGQMCTLFVEDEIAFGLENLKVEADVIVRRIEEMLAFVGMEGLNHKTVYELSGGQKQKVNFASVLAMRPRLLVADMPTANLDPVGSEEVFCVLRDLVTKGDTTCIVVENRVDELAYLADRVVVLNDGCVEYDGPPAVVFGEHGEALRDEIGVAIPQVAELALELRRRGCDVGVPLTVDGAVESVSQAHRQGRIEFVRPPDAPSSPSGGNVPLIDVEDVAFTYSDGTQALQGVSFQMEQGEILAIIGNNGSGKTTLAKHFAGLLCPSSGRVRVAGLDTSKAKVSQIAKKVSYVFQYPDQQFVTQEVFDEVAFNLRNIGVPEAEVKERVDEMLERFHLTEFREQSPFLLSGGEMRTLSVACMLTLDPEIVVLDEPTYGQDHAHVTALMHRLMEQQEKGTSIVMITHDMRLVAEYADHVIVMNEGRILFDGAPHQLFNRKELLAKAALKAPPICSVARQLADRGLPLPPERIITVGDFLRHVEVVPSDGAR